MLLGLGAVLLLRCIGMECGFRGAPRVVTLKFLARSHHCNDMIAILGVNGLRLVRLMTVELSRSSLRAMAAGTVYGSRRALGTATYVRQS